MSQNTRYRIAITEYTTLKGFGLSNSLEIEYDTSKSAKNALKRCVENIAGSLPGSHIQNISTMGFMIIDDSTGLVLATIMSYPYFIDEDKKEYLYRGHKITTVFDSETGKDALCIHRLDGRAYLYRFTLMGALDSIDWIMCSMEHVSISRRALNNNKEKEGN